MSISPSYVDGLELRIKELGEKVEKLTEERDALRSRRCEVCGYLEHEREHTGCLRKQLAALAAQNEKLREALEVISCNLGTGKLRSISEKVADDALSLPDLASPVLNRIRAEGVRKASTLVSLVRNDWASAGDNLSVQAAEYLISALDTRAAELENTNG